MKTTDHAMLLPLLLACQQPLPPLDKSECDDLCEPDGGVAGNRCMDDGVYRPIRKGEAGDLVISEVMANPRAVADADGEWFEVTALADIDINDLQSGPAIDRLQSVLTADECVDVAAGDQVLFARDSESAINGGLPPVAGTFAFSLGNEGGSLVLAFDDQIVDGTSWTTSDDGTSSELSANSMTAAANDDPQNWCAATSEYGEGDRGSPGRANVACAAPSMCLDDNDNPRPIVKPQPGDLRISEIMANPTAVPDADGEWFEVVFARDADLNGIQVGRNFDGGLDVEFTVTDPRCLPVTAGTRVVFARDVDPLINGGLPTSFIVDADIPLLQTMGSSLPLFVGTDGQLLASVVYRGDEVLAGRSLVVGNGGDRCAATSFYNPVDRGSPGGQDDPCPSPPGQL